jgi:hypothetical protein
MLANKSQIDHLNKSYMKNCINIISEDHTKRELTQDFHEESLPKNYSSINQKSMKKYS